MAIPDQEISAIYQLTTPRRILKSIVTVSITSYNSLSLSLRSGACQEDVAASTSVRHAGLSQARRLADARPKLSGRRSSSTVLSQVCLGLPVLRRQSLGGHRMQAWRVPHTTNF